MGWGRGDEINEEKWNKGRVLQSIDRQIRLRADRHASREEGFLGPVAGAKNGPIQIAREQPRCGGVQYENQTFSVEPHGYNEWTYRGKERSRGRITDMTWQLKMDRWEIRYPN
jgi:hypothetical protein